jgi:hypothetical protein
MREKSVLLVILIFYMSSSLAQEAISAAGGDGTGSGGSAAYTVGQILYSSSSGATGEMIHGVQQPYEISVVNGLEQFKELELILSTYPNPVTDLLILKVESLKWNDLNFQMYNSEGKILFSDKLLNTETNIDMSHLAPGIYFLKVNKEKDVVKTFKIIKK